MQQHKRTEQLLSLLQPHFPGWHLAQQSGNTSETARNSGLQLSVLRRWKKELEQDGEKAFPGKRHSQKGYSQDEELGQLQKENQRLKETVDPTKSG